MTVIFARLLLLTILRTRRCLRFCQHTCIYSCGQQAHTITHARLLQATEEAKDDNRPDWMNDDIVRQYKNGTLMKNLRKHESVRVGCGHFSFLFFLHFGFRALNVCR